MSARAARADNRVIIIREFDDTKEVDWAKDINETEAWELFKSLSKLYAKKRKPK